MKVADIDSDCEICIKYMNERKVHFLKPQVQ